MSNKKKIVSLLLIISFILYLMGILFPMFTNTRFFFFHKKFSLLSSISFLFDSGEFFLSIIVLLFSVIIPLLKYFIMAEALFFESNNKILNLLSSIGKWSMLDVFIMSLALVFYKFSMGILKFNFELGAYFFTISVILSLAVSFILSKKVK